MKIKGESDLNKKYFLQVTTGKLKAVMICYSWKGMMNDMTEGCRSFSGKSFESKDIDLIKKVTKAYPKITRKELCATICELIEWTTPAGKGKVSVCGEFLEILEQEGLISLPPKRKYKARAQELKRPDVEIKTNEINCKLSELEPIKLEIAYVGKDLNRWSACVEKYHMLGYKRVYGSKLHYFIKAGDIELGCLQFSASAWALAHREKWIGWDVEDRKQRLHLIINNSRFLIFPWVKVKYLASTALALVAKQIKQDWLQEFCYGPVLLETFVDLEQFKGTCYKASNWILLGETQGRGRMDRNNEYALSKKAIFMYPLQKDFRECLKGEKPYKKVDPDEQI